jgi:hypothetical protein
MMTVLAAGLARTRAGTECLIDDGLDRSRTTSAFCAAAKAAIDLLGIPRQFVGGCHRLADVVIANDVAGTNNHEKPARRRWSVIDSHGQLSAQRKNGAFEAIPIS